jgi:hypothetical protein
MRCKIGLACLVALSLIGCDADERTMGCVENTRRCRGNVSEVCVDHELVPVETCAMACSDTLGCVACAPGTATCQAGISTYCPPDGSALLSETCDPVQGVSCNLATGRCEGSCAASTLGRSNIGCEYFPVVTTNLVDASFSFGVAVSNTTDAPADITLEGGALDAPRTFTVGPKSVVVEELPWVDKLKDRVSALVSGGAYHLRSTQPVTVYQFNPTEFQSGGKYSVTNDASLLLPSNAWGRDYVVATYQHYVLPGFISVTAIMDGTEVTIDARARSVGGDGVPAIEVREPVTLTLARGDVLQITDYDGDLTGSHVTADRPVQVLGGHNCVMVPTTLSACDHLEESIFPVETLSRSYFVAAPAMPTLPDGKVEMVRIVATAAHTTLSYDPPQPGAPTSLLRAGDFVELALTDATFLVSADRKVLVAQFMTGQQAGGGMGDPAMTLAVATDQFRSEYLFHAPLSYETNYVNVVAPSGAKVVLDGNLLSGFQAIGATGHGLRRVELDDGMDGNHLITADMPFGISVYGYGSYTSYWYPGGTELKDIVL